MVADLRPDAAESAAREIHAFTGADVRSVREDASLEADVRHAIEETRRLFGGLDILVSNAGRQHVAMIEDFPVDTFRSIVDLMLVGPFLALRHALPLMRAQHYGRILHMASINGLVGFAGKAAYNSAKHGLIGLTKVAALECATYGITVNAVCPGYVDTPLVRGQLEDLATTRGGADRARARRGHLPARAAAPPASAGRGGRIRRLPLLRCRRGRHRPGGRDRRRLRGAVAAGLCRVEVRCGRSRREGASRGRPRCPRPRPPCPPPRP